jgi:23S rRNA (cytidine1920-2'-O)/16S rRNA (cytidine1409-2'-O)-methyltransferase
MSARARLRADLLLVERGLVPTRAQAQAAIRNGAVWAGDVQVQRPNLLLERAAALEVRERPRFVSRGGDKLDAALQRFAAAGLQIAGRRCLDVGASTGGFTDCLLQRGAAVVIAVDVGHDQLAASLRADPRVVLREGVNARTLTAADIGGAVALCVVDASFIGIGKLAPALAGLVVPGGDLVALLKPQFEAGPEAATRGRGVIAEGSVRDAALAAARADLAASGFTVRDEVDSALPGPRGNLERFVWAARARAL